MKVYIGEGAELLKFAMNFFKPKTYVQGSYVADQIGGGYNVQVKDFPDKLSDGSQVIKKVNEAFIFKRFPEKKIEDNKSGPIKGMTSDVLEISTFITLTPDFSIENSGGRDEDGFLVIVEDSKELDKKINKECWLEQIPKGSLERWEKDAVYKKLLLDFDLKLDKSFNKFKGKVKSSKS